MIVTINIINGARHTTISSRISSLLTRHIPHLPPPHLPALRFGPIAV
jgi:hypothetical protein